MSFSFKQWHVICIYSYLSVIVKLTFFGLIICATVGCDKLINYEEENTPPEFQVTEESFSILDNQLQVGHIAAVDSENDYLEYFITPNIFSISTTGKISFKQGHDIQIPTQSYSFTVIVSDGEFMIEKIFYILVTNSDTDNDGVDDIYDLFPNNPSETVDSDGDGVGDNQDAFPDDALQAYDADNDGVGDDNDVFPNDPTETTDFDNDGIGDNADTDDDNDGVADTADLFPKDSNESADFDGDGVGDNADLDDDNDGLNDDEEVAVGSNQYALPQSLSDLQTMLMNYYTANSPETCKSINQWNISQVTDLSYLFSEKGSFNCDIGSWDVSQVTTMAYMFHKAYNFNQNLASWDVAHVTSMSYMFYLASSFNQPLVTWDVSNVTDMTRMFWDASAFDQALNDWDVSSVVNMKGMFYSSQFNQPLNAWNVSSVTNMSEMFSFSSQFDQDISQWNVGNVTTCDDFSLNASALQTGNKPTFTVSSCN